MATLWVRQATLADADRIYEIINEAKAFIKSFGLLQWQQGYPYYETVVDDIKKGISYVCLDGDKIVGACSYMSDIDPNYIQIYDGSWSSDPYISIHRTCTTASYRGKGVGKVLFDFAEEYARQKGIHVLKIDTHKGNLPMRRLCEKCGFRYAGTIYIQRDEEDTARMAFEKII